MPIFIFLSLLILIYSKIPIDEIKSYEKKSIHLNNSYQIYQYQTPLYIINSLNKFIIQLENINNDLGYIFIYDNFSKIEEENGEFKNYNEKLIGNFILHDFNIKKNYNKYYIIFSSKNKFNANFFIFSYQEQYNIQSNSHFYQYFYTNQKYMEWNFKINVTFFNHIQFTSNFSHNDNISLIIYKDQLKKKKLYSIYNQSIINYVFNKKGEFYIYLKHTSNNNNLNKYYIPKISIYNSEFEDLNKLEVNNQISIPLHINGDMGIKNFYIDIENNKIDDTITLKFNPNFKSIINLRGIFYSFYNTSLSNSNNFNIIDSSDNLDIYENYINIKKTDDKQKVYILKVELSQFIFTSNELFTIELIPFILYSNLKQEYSKSIKNKFYILENSFNYDSQYIILFAGNSWYKQCLKFIPEVVPNIKNESCIQFSVFNKSTILGIENKTLIVEPYSIYDDDSYIFFEVIFMDDINFYYFKDIFPNFEHSIIKYNQKIIIYFNSYTDGVLISKTIYGNPLIYYTNVFHSINTTLNYEYYSEPIDPIFNYQNEDDHLFIIKCKNPCKFILTNYRLNEIDLFDNLSYSIPFYIPKNDLLEKEFYSTKKFDMTYQLKVISEKVKIYFNFNGKKNKISDDDDIITYENEININNSIKISSNKDTFITLYLGQNYTDILSNNHCIIYDFNYSYSAYNFVNLRINSNLNSDILIGVYKSFEDNISEFYYFENSSFYLLKKNEYLYFDLNNPMTKDNISKSFISLYFPSCSNCINYTTQYFQSKKILQYETIELSLSENKKFQIYEYYNLEGRIIIDLQEKPTQKIKLYIYKERQYIFHNNLKFENYLKEIDFSQNEQYIINDNYTDFLNGYFYFVFVSENSELIKTSFLIYSPLGNYEISSIALKVTTLINDYNNKFNFINEIQFEEKYLHYEWYNNHESYSTSLSYNGILLNKNNFNCSDHFDLAEDFEFFITLNTKRYSDSMNNYFFSFLIYLTDEPKIKRLDDDKLIIEVLSPQIIYIKNYIGEEGIGETIYFNFIGEKFVSNPKIQFYENDFSDSESFTPNINQFELEMNVTNDNIYSFISKDYLYVLIGIEVGYYGFTSYSFQKIYPKILVQTDYYKEFYMNEKKNYYINKQSFPSSNIKILLYSSKMNKIKFNQNIFYNNDSNIFLISYDMINTYEKIEFNVSNNDMNNESFIFEIKYLNNIIYYYNNKSRLNKTNLKINECKDYIYYIGIYEYLEENKILYIQNLTDNSHISNIYYDSKVINKNINNILAINSDKKVYEYPFKIQSKIDLLIIECSNNIEIELNYLEIQNDSIKFNIGAIIPFFIEKNKNYQYSIDYPKDEFNLKIFIIKNKVNKNNLDIKFIINNELKNLKEEENIIEIKNHIIDNKTIFFFTYQNDYLIFIYILDKIPIKYIKNIKQENNFDSPYNVFVLPINKSLNTNIIGNILIENIDNKKHKICYNKDYGNIYNISFEKKNCINITTFKISIEPNGHFINLNENISYYVSIYIKDYNKLNYSFNFFNYTSINSEKKIQFKENIILSFNNKLILPDYKGEIIFKFDENILGNIYIYKKRENINLKHNEYINYNEIIQLNSSNLLYTYSNPSNNTYFFIIQLNEKKLISLLIYNAAIPKEIKINEKLNKIYESNSNSSKYIFYINNKYNQQNIYLHYQWKNINKTNSLIKIQNENKTIEFKSNLTVEKYDYFKLENNKYYIIIEEYNSNHKENVILQLYFYFSPYNNIFPLIEKNKVYDFPIISNQILYFYINISRLILNEEEFIQIDNYGNVINYRVKYFEHENLDQMIIEDQEYHYLNEIECNNTKCNYSIIKNDENYKSVLLIADIISNYNILKHFQIQLINYQIFISSPFFKPFFQNESKIYYINKTSFINSKYILIKSDQEYIISFINSTLPDGLLAYTLTEDLLKDRNEFLFEVKNDNNHLNYEIEIKFLDNNNYNLVHYYFDTITNVKPFLYKINDCNIFNGIIISFINNENFQEGVVYLKIIEGDSKIYYIEYINSLNEFLDPEEKSEYLYPFDSSSKNEYISFKCNKKSIINFKYYDKSFYQNEYNRRQIPFYIEIYQDFKHSIKNINFLKSNFAYKIELIKRLKTKQKIIFNFCGIETILTSDNNKFINTNVQIKNYDIKVNLLDETIAMLLLSYQIEKDQIRYYNETINNIPIEKEYNVFSYSQNEFKSNFAVIYIRNISYGIDIFYKIEYGNINYIFPIEDEFIQTENENFTSILFENPHTNKSINNEETYLLVYITQYSNLIIDYNYFYYEEIYNYEKYELNFGGESQIFYFENKKKGEIYINFENNLNEGTYIYIYKNKEKIHKNKDGFDGNYIISDNLSNLNKYSFTIEEKDLYIILYNKKGINNNNMTIISPKMDYEIPINQIINININNNQNSTEFNYTINKLPKEKYLHIQWIISDPNLQGSINIYYNDTNISNFEENNFYYQLNANINYNIQFRIINQKNLIVGDSNINIIFYISDYSKIILFDESVISIPILTPQIIYLIHPISSYDFNEDIKYNTSNVTIESLFDYEKNETYFINNNILNKKWNKISDKKCENNICSYSIKKPEQQYNYLILKIEFSSEINYLKDNIFKIEKVFPILIIDSNKTINMIKNQHKLIKFNSTLLTDDIIIIYSNNEDAISVKNNKMISNKKLYAINKEIINNNNIIYELYDPINDYNIDIKYIKNEKIFYYSENREIISSYRFQINDISEEFYYYGIINSEKYGFLYIENIFGTEEIYFKNISNFLSIDDLFNNKLIHTKYTYPKLIDNDYYIIKINYDKPSLIYINYYPFIDYEYEGITLNYGEEYLLFIKSQDLYEVKINNNSEVYLNSFNIEIKVISPVRTLESLEISVLNKLYYLSSERKIKLDQLKINHDNNIIKFGEYSEDIFIKIKIGLNQSSYEKYNITDDKKEIYPNKKYVVFIYPNETNILNNSYTKMIIINKYSNHQKICINEYFGDIKFLNQPNNCSFLKPEEKKIFEIKLTYSNQNKNENDLFLTSFYFENPNNITISFTFQKGKNKFLNLIIIIFLILIVLGLYFIINNLKNRRMKRIFDVENLEEEIKKTTSINET